MTSDAPAPAVVVHAATASPGVVGGVATAVIDALKTSPVLLLIVLLNATFCGAAAYYLLQVEAYRHKERVEVSGDGFTEFLEFVRGGKKE